MVSLGDLLAATDRLGPPDAPPPGRAAGGRRSKGQRPPSSFYVACSRFTPGTDVATAARLLFLHMHHHLRLGFQARGRPSR